MKTFHVGGMNPVRRYKTLGAALVEAKDDDTIELHKNITFSGRISHNIILNGNGHVFTVENGSVGLDCEDKVVIKNLTFVSEPRSNSLILRNGGRLEKVTARIKGPARVLYPTIICKKGNLYLKDCDIMRMSAELDAVVTAKACTFRDYYGGICHFPGLENLSIFSGAVRMEQCQIDCCYFKGHSHISSSQFGVFNRSCGDVTMINCQMEPTVNDAAVNLAKEPEDGPLEKANPNSRFSFEQESGNVTIVGYTSQIPEEFVGFHVLSGSLNFQNVKNEDEEGYHLIRNASLSFVDCEDMSFYETQDTTLSMVRSKVSTSAKTKTAMEKLQELIGLGTVKSAIQSILNTITVNRKAKNHDFGFSYHMIFAGDPGTGKTTVAKIVAQALFEIGAIPENKCTEVSVDRLVKGYVGQTAEHVRKVLDEALGGVLFIDEAYELSVKEGQTSFNSEVLSVLIRYMEEHRDNLVVIAAGYEKEMREFLASNVGLSRRFQWVSFPDYTAEEMSEIFESMRKSYEEEYESQRLSALLPQLFESLTRIYERKPDAYGRITNGGNGGLVRNVFQCVLQARNNRIAGQTDNEFKISQSDLKAGFRKEMEKALQI